MQNDHLTHIPDGLTVVDLRFTHNEVNNNVYGLVMKLHFKDGSTMDFGRLVNKEYVYNNFIVPHPTSAEDFISLFYPNLDQTRDGKWLLEDVLVIANVYKNGVSEAHFTERLTTPSESEEVTALKQMLDDKPKVTEEYTGGSSSYYQLHISHPVTEGQDEFDVECLDIIRALNMPFELANIFKAVWRISAAQQGKQKKGNNTQYDLEKIVFFAQSYLEYLNKINGKED